MTILYINYPPVSTLGDVPQLIYVGTNDTLATVTTPGYLNAVIPVYGDIFNENQMAMVVTIDQLTVILSLSISGGIITLVEPPATGAITSITGTPNEITASPTTGAVVLSIPAIFIAPGSIAATTTISGTTFNSSTLTASTALASDSSKNIVSSITTATELGFVHGATSNIQNQINAITSSLVTSVSGTANQIDASSSTGNVTLSIDSTFIAPGTVTSTGLLTSLLGLTVTGGAISLGADSADDAINIGTGASSGRIITIGNTTAATGLALYAGTGEFLLDGVGATTYTIGPSTTTGIMEIGGTAQTSNLILGSSSQTNVIKIGNGTGRTTVNILTNSTNGAFNVCSGATTAVITIGGTAQSGTITLGNSSAINTIDIGTGTGGGSVNIGTGATGAKVIAIGTGAAANLITIGTQNTSASLTLNSGSAGIVMTGVSGVTVSNQAFVTINTSTGALGSTTASGLVSSISGTANEITASASTGAVTLSIPSTFIAPGSIAATTTVSGTTFNSSTLTASTALASDGSMNIVSSSTTATELGYVHGVTSAIQTQLNAITGSIVTSISGTANEITASSSTGAITLSIPSAFIAPGTISVGNLELTGNTLESTNSNGDIHYTPNGIGKNILANAQVTNLTTSTAIVTDTFNNLLSSSTTATELAFVHGVTSNIQTQLNAITGSIVTAIAGTANEITASASTGSVTLSIPNAFIAPGTISVGNLELTTNTLESTNSNGNINLTPNGTGINVLANAQVTSLTASTAIATDASKNLVSSSTTATELGFVHGVTSAIQTQLNAITGSIVTSITGTAAQITASSSTGAVTLSIPSSPSFPGIPSSVGYLLVPQSSPGAGGVTALTSSSIQTQYLTGTLAQTFQLPDATTLSIGWKFEFANLSTMPLTITNNGTSTIYVLPPGGYTRVTYVVSSGTNGIWGVEAFLPSNCAFGSTGGVITGTLGVTTSISTPEYLLTGASSGTISILPQAAAGTYNFNLPITAGSSGQVLTSAGGGSAPMTWTTAGGSVTSVGVSSSTGLIVASTPVTTSGTITVDLPAAIPGRNLLFNGAMLVAQRGTSVAIGSSSAGYTLDRWQLSVGSSQASTVTQSAGPLSGSFYARVQRNSGQTGVLSVIYFAQSLTLDMSAGVAGNKITLSFIALAGANFSPTSSNITVTVYSGTGATNKSGIVGAFTGSATPISATQALTGSAVQYTFTSGSVVSSSATQLCVQFSWTPTGTAGANDWAEFTNVNLVVSPTLTNFQNLSYIEELCRCQYFFQVLAGACGYCGGTTGCQLALNYLYPMFATPTVSSLAVSGVTVMVVTDTTANYTQSSFSVTTYLTNNGALFQLNNFTGLTNLRPVALNVSVNGVQLTLTAELT